jgi:drug/metabolite transporter (DMT)-like permease
MSDINPMRRSKHFTALAQMFLVTLLWSSSFPIHKALINGGMPPLSLAAYRYFSASLILFVALEVRARTKNRSPLPRQRLDSSHWPILLAIGLFMYTAQGVHLTALSLISASDSGLVSMTFMPVAVAVLVSIIEKTPPGRIQLCGLGIILAGIYTYFPHNLQSTRLAGILLNILSSSMWAVAVVLTHIAVSKMKIASLKLTTVSMITGSSVLLIIALLHDRFYVPNSGQILWMAYLALVNTAFGFALYNHTMKSLGAFEIATFQDSMVIQIGILSAIFLGESITPAMAMGMLLVVFGVVVVQYFAPERPR